MSYNTLFGKVPDDWTVSKIGEIAELRQGLQISTKKRLSIQEEGSIPLLKITDLPKGEFSEFVKDIPENYIATKDDIIYTRTGQVGLVYTNVEGCVHNNCFKVIMDYNKFDKKYMYYYLNSPQVRTYANVIASGSVQKDLTHKAFNTVKIGYPKLEKQKKIADVLSSLDGKIELNNEMNKTLEEMAQSIFKRWFVDFEFPNEDGQPYKSSGGEMVESELGMTPKGWEVKELGEVININPRESLKKGEEKIYVEMANLPLNYARITNYIEKPFNGGTKFRNGDTLLARITPCLENGKTAIVDFLEDGELAFGSTEYIVMRPKILNQYYIYCLARDEDFRSYAIKNMNGSSGRQRVDANTIKQYIIPCPNEKILELYNNVCIRIFNQMKKNDDESNILSNIRDVLLPQLMRGEIIV